MDTDNYYNEVHLNASEVLKRSLENSTGFGIGHQVIDDLEKWRLILEGRSESTLLTHVQQELRLALYLNSIGLYRASFSALRLSLELSFGLVYFSIHRMELAEWLNGSADLLWRNLSDRDVGILSPRFANAFFPELNGYVANQLLVATKMYRELSEFVHGNTNTLSKTPREIVFNKDLHSSLAEYISTFADVVTFSFCLRFSNELPEANLRLVAADVLDRLGHIECIRDRYTSLGATL